MTLVAPVPSLDELAAHPERARELPTETAADLLARTLALQTALLARLLAGQDGARNASGGDCLLTVGEAARTLGVSKDWLYRRAGRLPFTVRLEGQLRFSGRGIERYIRQRRGA